MLHWRMLGGDEKAQLQELNARLYEYVSRVRQLEQENQQLLDELQNRRGEEDWWAAWQGRYQAEVSSLRRQLEELSWDKSLAEGERDSLWRELQELQQLSREARAVRGQLDAELGAQRQQLKEALGARAALEALLGRLQDEHQRLLEGHERDVRELRQQVSTFSLQFRARQPPREPQLNLQEVHDSYALLVSESWQETFQLYQDKVRELEEKVRRGQESRQEAEEEKRLCQLEVESLHREAQELDQLRQRLEEELLRMREKYDLEMEENQRVIDFLEDEKQNLTMTLTDRLKDYQELLQVKTGLNLEVATYRALLEGESNPEILVWMEHIQNVPREVRNTSCQYVNSILQRENKRNIFSREKITSSNKNISTPYTKRSTFFGPQATIVTGSAPRKDFLGPSYSSSSTLRQETSYERTAKDHGELRTLPTTRGLLRSIEPQVKVIPDIQKTESRSSITTYLTKESTSAQKPSQQHKDVRMSTSASTQSHERSVFQGKKTEERVSTEERKHKIEPTKPRQEEKMFDSKEKASEERNLRWEEMTKLDKEARERESMHLKGKAKGGESTKERTTIFGEKREIQIPVSFEGQGHGKASQNDKVELSVKDIQTFPKKGASDSKTKWTDERGLKFKVDTSDAVDSTKDDSTRKTIAENIVSSILQQFVQPSDSETSVGPSLDTKVTYMERKELPGDGKAKTEIIVESKLLEEIDVSDEDSLKHLLSKGAKEVEIKGKSAESMIGDIINLGLKGREGRAKVVNVEIVEEPLGYVTDERTDFSTPFEVEEVDDVSLGLERHYSDEEGDEETSIAFSGNQLKKTTQPHQNITHFEEVTEASDSEGEQRYFVSTPDESSGVYDKDEDSVYGQIHVEEESTIKYSWQDEVAQSTEKRRKRNNLPGDEFSSTSEIFSPEEDVDYSHLKEQPKSDQLHAESIVIEKEIKIPHEFQTSIKEIFSKDPKHQLVETLGQLEGSLPESVREELSVLTKESQGDAGNISVKKFEKTTDSGSVTIVAEVNLSQTLDADQFDLEQLSKDDSSKVEKILQSAVLDSFEKHQAQEPESPDSKYGVEVSGSSIKSKRWASRETYSSSSEKDDGGGEHYTAEHVFCQGPVSATVEVSSPRGFAQSHVLEDVNQSVRHIKIGPTEIRRTEQIFYEGPTSGVVEMDMTNREETPSTARSTRETTIIFPARKEAKVHIVSDDGDWKDNESKKDKEASMSFQVSAAQDKQAYGEHVTEKAMFDKTVQLQRMVDQRSVISDEKKIALLYLDKEEEEEENDGHWF
ncbi:synemin [Dromiciops gliroides]|uniref:synemin n=1 Tax=Dromiciops gliroides TaxID=33562 RepID=UPI001CC791BF|nr:synemin [Dromiciops gliroides]